MKRLRYIIIICIYITILSGCYKEKIQPKLNSNTREFYYNKGKQVGRNSMLTYLIKTQQLKDSVSIDLYDVLKIESKEDKLWK